MTAFTEILQHLKSFSILDCTILDFDVTASFKLHFHVIDFISNVASGQFFTHTVYTFKINNSRCKSKKTQSVINSRRHKKYLYPSSLFSSSNWLLLSNSYSTTNKHTSTWYKDVTRYLVTSSKGKYDDDDFPMTD